MKQDKVFKATKKATETPLAFTRSVIEHSKILRHPSPIVTKIGMIIGGCFAAGLLFTGLVQLHIGKLLWAISSFSVGAITIMSHFIYYKRENRK